MKYLGVLACLTLVAAHAAAEPIDDAPASSIEGARPHAIYLEALGKGGMWGLGYEHALGERMGAGGVASFTIIGGQRVYSLTPYLLAYPVRSGHHGWFVDAGASLVRIVTPSPVPEWQGMTASGIGGELSSGYEYRDHFLFRIYGQMIGGKSGLAPWGGVSIGWTL